jgi:hypothetical protein
MEKEQQPPKKEEEAPNPRLNFDDGDADDDFDPEEDDDDADLVTDASRAAVADLPGPSEWKRGAAAVVSRTLADENVPEFGDDSRFVLCTRANAVAAMWVQRKFEETDGCTTYVVCPLGGGDGDDELILLTNDQRLKAARKADTSLEQTFLARFSTLRDQLVQSGAVVRREYPRSAGEPVTCAPQHGWHLRRAAIREHFPELAAHLASESEYRESFMSRTGYGGELLFVPLSFWLACASEAKKPE